MCSPCSRQFERDLGKVIDVLQPGPLGIIEHKFSDAETAKARQNAESAVRRWKNYRNDQQ